MLTALCNQTVLLYDDTIDHAWGDSVRVSFWIPNYLDDLMGRNIVTVESIANDGSEETLARGNTFYFVTAVEGRAGLMSIPVHLPDNAVRLRVSAGNKSLPTRQVSYDRLLIAPQGKNVALSCVQQGDTIKLLNNIPLR